MEKQSLNDKVAIITGAGSGIGKAAALALVSQGARVVLVGRRIELLNALQEELGADRALVVRGDVADQHDVDRVMRDTVDRFGCINVLLANAGQFKQGRIADVETEILVSMVDTNLVGVIRCIKGVLPSMIARRSGDIIVTASISGHRDIENEAVYSATKHAVVTLVNLLRNEVAAQGLRVASISPGIVLNDIWGVTDPAEIEAGMSEQRGLISEDIAELIVHMLRMPRRITLRDILVLPQGQII
jgi:ribitol 2-dehydrogenase